MGLRRRGRRRWPARWAAQCCSGGEASEVGEAGEAEATSQLLPAADDAVARPACGNASGPAAMKRADAAVEPAVEATENGAAEMISRNTDDTALRELPVTLTTGSIVMLEALVQPTAMRFHIDLISGSTRSPDIAFHLNPRMQQKVVVRNSRIRGHWGSEELASVEKFPFSRGEHFSLQLLCAEEEFMVAVNGNHFCTFTYRVPVVQIRLIEMSGDFLLKKIDCQKCVVYPIINDKEKGKYAFSLSETTPLSSFSQGTVVTTPLTLGLPKTFSDGKTVQISGKVKLLPYLFYINLQQGTQTWPHPEIPLHINPRFGEKGPLIACNSWLSGKWGLEEREVITGLRASKKFTLHVTSENDGYLIALNGISIYKFIHRISPKIVDTLVILGDIWIDEVCLR